MQITKRLTGGVLVPVVTLALCGGQADAAAVSLPDRLEMAVGDAVRLSPIFTTECALPPQLVDAMTGALPLCWSVEDGAVACLDGAGLLTAHAAGATRVRLRCGGADTQMQVVVTAQFSTEPNRTAG